MNVLRSPRRIFLLAGESSGDLQAALLAEALRTARPDLDLCGVGGPKMSAAGVRILLSSEELAVVGLVEVLSRLPHLLAAYERVQGLLASERPHLFVPIDFPDFNFRMLPRASRLGIPIVWHISPQVWAWRADRVELLRRFVRRLLVIFPFEEPFFRRHHVRATWVGHPLVDTLKPVSAEERRARRRAIGLDPDRPTLALLPGSRRSELSRIGPLFALVRRALVRDRTGPQFVLGRAPSLPDRCYASLLADGPLVRTEGTDALRVADAALAASGTVTLEAALLGVPTAVAYRTSSLTFAIARRLVKVPHIAMANLVAEERLFPEFLQDEATPAALSDAANRLLTDGEGRQAILRGLERVRDRLGPPGAAARAAAEVLRELDAVET